MYSYSIGSSCRAVEFGSRKKWISPAGLMFLLLLVSCSVPAFAAEGLTILLMPGGYEGDIQFKSFNISDSKKLFPRLRFENTELDWDSLKIGHQYWLCDQLEKFAQNLNAPLYVRFVGWNDAMTQIDALRDRYDVAQIPSTWTAHFIAEGVLAKSHDVNEARYPPGLLQTCSIEGKKEIYAVPWQSDTRVLYYRKELTDDPDKLRTFAGFVECLHDRYKQTGSPPFGVGLNRKRDAWDVLHNTLAYFFSGQLLEKRYWQWYPVFYRGEPRKGLKDFWSLTQEGLVYFIDEGEKVDGLTEGLLEGRYDVVFGGPHLRAIFETDPNIRATPLPQLIPGRKYAFLGGCHLSVSRAARERGYERDAQALVKFLTSREAQVALLRNTGALPARRDAIEQFIAENLRWKAIGETLEYAKPYPSIPRWAKDVERDVVLDHFYLILRSIQEQEEWPVIEKQLKAAARELEPRFPWLVFLFGASLIVLAVLVARIALARREPKPTHVVLETKTVLLNELTLRLDVVQYSPISIRLTVFHPDIPPGADWTIDEPTSALLVEGMRNSFVHRPFCIWVKGKLLDIDNARRIIGTEVQKKVRNSIRNAVERAAVKAHTDPMTVTNLDNLHVLPGIGIGPHAHEHEFVLGQYATLESDILSVKELIRSFLSEIKESDNYSTPISKGRLTEMLEASIQAINADYTGVPGWLMLVFAIEKLLAIASISVDDVKERLPKCIPDILPYAFLRYLRAANMCFADRSVELSVIAEEEFAKRAETLFKALQRFEWLPEPNIPSTPNWLLASRLLISDLRCKWLEPLIKEVNLEDPLCLAAISNSSFWEIPESDKDQDGKDAAETVWKAFMATSWFRDALDFLQNKYQGKAKEELSWYLWMGIREHGLKTGTFPSGKGVTDFKNEAIKHAEGEIGEITKGSKQVYPTDPEILEESAPDDTDWDKY